MFLSKEVPGWLEEVQPGRRGALIGGANCPLVLEHIHLLCGFPFHDSPAGAATTVLLPSLKWRRLGKPSPHRGVDRPFRWNLMGLCYLGHRPGTS